MTMSMNEYLQSHPVFTVLPQTMRARLAAAAIGKHYQVGEFLTHADDTWPYLFLVVSGEVQAIKEAAEGRTLTIAEIGEGEFFWGLAFFDETIPNPVAIRASREAHIYLWQQEMIQPILQENGEFTWELTRLMVRRMLHASQMIEGLAFQPVAGRLARLLLTQFSSTGEPAMARFLTLDEMAARVSTSREIVCRTLYRFADQGFIDVTRTEFLLTDRDGLAGVADKV
jgi:CRP/FNR family transcriptional regulator, cyclic AMP receptor protein